MPSPKPRYALPPGVSPLTGRDILEELIGPGGREAAERLVRCMRGEPFILEFVDPQGRPIRHVEIPSLKLQAAAAKFLWEQLNGRAAQTVTHEVKPAKAMTLDELRSEAQRALERQRQAALPAPTVDSDGEGGTH